MYSKKSSFNKILILVFGIAFGLVALVMIFQGVKTSSDIRSRAAQTNQIYKQWEFNSADTEGWSGVSPYIGIVSGGKLMISGMKAHALPSFRNTSIEVSLPNGLKSVSFSMAVGNTRIPLMKDINSEKVKGISDKRDDEEFDRSVKTKIVCPQDTRTCPDGSIVGRSGNGCSFIACSSSKVQRKVVGHLYYKLAGSEKFERPLQFMGLADGSFRTYTVNLPNSSPITIDAIRIVLTSGVKNSETISIDWIRLLGPIISTPTPTVCNTGLKDYIPNKPSFCASGSSLGITYVCWDGSTGYINEGTTCYLIDDMKAQATTRCAGKSNCIPTTFVTAKPSPPVPRGCVKACNALTGECSESCPTPVLASSPTPTPMYGCNQVCDTSSGCHVVCSEPPVSPYPTQ